MKYLAILILTVLVTFQSFSQEKTSDTRSKNAIINKSGWGNTKSTNKDGNWSSPSTWQGSIPSSNDNVIINNNVIVDDNFGCMSLTINSSGSLTIKSGKTLTVNGNLTSGSKITLTDGNSTSYTYLDISGDFTNNSGGVIYASGSYSRIEFIGTSAQKFYNNGNINGKLYGMTLDNTAGLTLLNGSFNIVRVNVFSGTITNSDKITLGDGLSFGLVQRGVSGATNPAGSFDKAFNLNVGAAGSYYIRYDGSTTSTTTGYEIPASSSVYYIFSNNPNNTVLSKNVTLANTIELDNGQFQIGAYMVTMNGGTFLSKGGTLTGGSTSKISFTGSNPNAALPSVTLNTLTLNNSNGLDLTGSVTITNLLTLTSGVVSTDTNKIYFTSTATNPIETNGNRIDGYAVMNARNIGTGSLNYLGCYFAAGSDNLGNVTVTRISGTKAIINQNSMQSIAVKWDITADNQPVNGRNMTYNWFSVYDNMHAFGSSNRGQVYYSTDNGSTWGPIGSLINPVTGQTTRAMTVNTTHYSVWSIGSEDSPLPVHLSSFTSSVNGSTVKLSWSTSSEVNNSGFEIYRSEKGMNSFTKLGFVEGNGTKNTQSNYTYEDKKVNTGKYDYKLKQIDNNGNYEFFTLGSTVEVGVPSKYFISQNYPNPFNPMTKIDFSVPSASKVKITVYDITGKAVKTLVDENKAAGNYTVEFSAANLSSGIYFCAFTANDYKEIKKMTLIK
ncbi:MAG: T9SS type A sorting domain-containing protein [Bacteroidetes bacterium]|nr:T9SS type A sorting domain-containing protein [Bacteroidota bacterium]